MRLGGALQSVVCKFFKLCQFCIIGELGCALLQKSECARVVRGMQAGIDLLDQLGFCLDAGLLLASFLQALDFKLQAGILTVNGAQNFPIIEGVAERILLFMMVSAGNDRVHQIALVFHQAQGALEVGFIRMQVERLLQNVDALIQIGLGFDLTVYGSHKGRQLLPLLFFSVILERLKNRVGGILGQISVTGCERLAEIMFRQLFARLGVRRVHGIVLRAHLVVKALIRSAAFGAGNIGSAAVQFQNYGELAERTADVALLPGIHGGAMNLRLLLAQLVVLLFLAIDFRNQLQRAGFLRSKLQNILQGFASVRIGVIVGVLACQAIPVFNLFFTAPAFDL